MFSEESEEGVVCSGSDCCGILFSEHEIAVALLDSKQLLLRGKH